MNIVSEGHLDLVPSHKLRPISKLVPFPAPTLFLIAQVLLLVYIVNLQPCLAVASLASPFSLTNSHLFTTPPQTHLHLRTLASLTCVLQPFITINVLIYNEPKSINVENRQKPLTHCAVQTVPDLHAIY